eukprot:gene40644-50283_t
MRGGEAGPRSSVASVRVADAMDSCPVGGARMCSDSSEIEEGTSAGGLLRPDAPATSGLPSSTGDVSSSNSECDSVGDAWEEDQYLDAGERDSPAVDHIPPAPGGSNTFSPQELLEIDAAVAVMRSFMPSLRRRNADPAPGRGLCHHRTRRRSER